MKRSIATAVALTAPALTLSVVTAPTGASTQPASDRARAASAEICYSGVRGTRADGTVQSRSYRNNKLRKKYSWRTAKPFPFRAKSWTYAGAAGDPYTYEESALVHTKDKRLLLTHFKGKVGGAPRLTGTQTLKRNFSPRFSSGTWYRMYYVTKKNRLKAYTALESGSWVGSKSTRLPVRPGKVKAFHAAAPIGGTELLYLITKKGALRQVVVPDGNLREATVHTLAKSGYGKYEGLTASACGTFKDVRLVLLDRDRNAAFSVMHRKAVKHRARTLSGRTRLAPKNGFAWRWVSAI